MADSVNFWHWWISLKINVNFWDWVRDTYYDVELLHLANDVDCQSLDRPAKDGHDPLNTCSWCGREWE
jgi:hypothetical protein